MTDYTVLDLFTGIGGFSLGLERAGFRTIACCEIEPEAIKIIKKRFPGVPVAGDIRKLNYSNGILFYDGLEIYRGTIFAICGGFPCQPYSVAGEQQGADDDRHLWPEYDRLICEIKPSWVIAENVYGIVNMELDAVLSDLEAAGYAWETFVIPACSTDAWHRRDRTWILADAERQR